MSGISDLHFGLWPEFAMTRGFYHALIIFFLVLAPLMAINDIVVVAGVVPRAWAFREVLASIILVGAALQLVAAVGMWREERWGLWVLGASAVLCLPSPGMVLGPVFVFLGMPSQDEETKIEGYEARNPNGKS